MLIVSEQLLVELEHEREERKDAELSVAAFKRQLSAMKDKAASVQADIEQYQAIVQNLRRGELLKIFSLNDMLN